jgi:hypothetical protein
MLEILLIVLTGAAVVATAGIMTYRKRRPAAPYRPDDEEPDEAALLLYLSRARNTSPTVAPVGGAPVPAPPMPARPAPRRYIAPQADVPADGVVQLWPGRLEPVERGADQEIRFLRTAGVNRFTFGRSAGPAQTHIQLLAPTASRMHAYVIVENGRWRIGNMSETNRVLVNGAPLETGDADRWLTDGDRIELGEVGFVFRER